MQGRKFRSKKNLQKPLSFAAEMMHFFKTNRPFLLVALGFFAFCAGLATGWPYGDELLFFNDFRHEPLNSVFRFWTRLGEERAYLAMIFAAALAMDFRKAVLFFVMGCAVIGLAYSFKTVFHTDRPATFFEKKGMSEQVVFVPEIYINRGATSFPSGHSMGAFALWGLLAFHAKKKKRAAILAILPIGVAVSRLFLVQHFLIDVIAGGLVGLFLAYLFWKIGTSPRLFRAPFWSRSLLFWNKKIA